MTSHHDYSEPPALRDRNLERDTSVLRLPSSPPRQPTPRLALWLSIAAGLLLVVGLCYAVITEANKPSPSPTGTGSDGSITALALPVSLPAP